MDEITPDGRSDMQRFYSERIVAAHEASSLTSTELYEQYCTWCEDNGKEAFALPRMTREIAVLGVKKERIGKRTRYFGIALKSPRAWSNKSEPPPRPPLVRDSEVQRFFRERIVAAEFSSLTSTEVYAEYCAWCKENDKEPFAPMRVAREITELGVKKERIGKRTRYFGFALKSADWRR